MDRKRLDELISGYLDRSLSDDENRELVEALRSDAGARRHFLLMCNQDVALHDLSTAAAASAVGRAGAVGPRPGRSRRVLRSLVAAAAAALLVAGLLGLRKEPPPGDDRPPEDPDGARLLSDGSSVLVTKDSLAKLTDRPGEGRPCVNLDRGTVTCRVPEGKGEFRVFTPVGDAAARTADFSVELREADEAGTEAEGDAAMKRSMLAGLIMTVAVTSGEVRVRDLGGAEQVAMAGAPVSVSAPEGGAPEGRAPETALAAADVTKDVTQGALRFKDSEGSLVECPLLHTDVQADVSGFIARVKVTQTFHNPAQDRIEAVYVFPLPHHSAVDSMTMVVGERKVVGLIKRREAARQIYEQALSQGQLAALLEQERPNIFTQSVGNIRPGQTVKIEITYVDVLEYDMGVYAFHFPMVVGPRYNPAGWNKPITPVPALSPDAAPAAAAVPASGAPPVVTKHLAPDQRNGHDISLALKLDAGVPVRDIRSTNHKVRLDQTGLTTATCSILPEDSIPNKTFELKYAVVGQKPEMAVLAHADSGADGYFMLMVQPKEDEVLKKAPPREITFLVDVSGSMSGAPTAKNQQIMKMFLEQSQSKDNIQVITFQSDTQKLFPKPVPCTPGNIRMAVNFTQATAGGGGTEMLKGIKAAIEDPLDPERVRIVILLTDGYIGNEAQIIEEVGRSCGDKVRFWCLGIGSEPNRFLVDGVAKKGGGMGKVVSLNTTEKEVGELVEEIVVRIHRAQLADIVIDWGGLNVYETYPARVPELWAGRPVIVFGRYTGGGAKRIRISGRAEGEPVSFEVPVALPLDEPEHDVLAVTWARKKIESLMESVAWMDDNPEVVEEVTRLALEYKLMSQYTSFVAVDAESVDSLEEPPAAPPRRVGVAVPLPAGVSYEGIFGLPGDAGVLGELDMERASMRPGLCKFKDAKEAEDTISSIPLGGKEAWASIGTGMARQYGYRHGGGRRDGLSSPTKSRALAGQGRALSQGFVAPPSIVHDAKAEPCAYLLDVDTARLKDSSKQQASAAPYIHQSLAQAAQKSAEADAKRAKELLESAGKLLKDGSPDEARSLFQLVYLLDEARFRLGASDGSAGAAAETGLEDVEKLVSAARLKAEPKLGTKLDVVIREKELPEALAEVAAAAKLDLQLASEAVAAARALVGSRTLRTTYLDLRRCTVAAALDALCGPARLDWSVEKGGRVAVTSARGGAVAAPWTYDVSALAIPDEKELAGKDWQENVKTAGDAAAEFLAAARMAVGAKEDSDCFWLAPGWLVVYGDAAVHAKAAAFIASLEKGEGELGKKAAARLAGRKDLDAKAGAAAGKREAYGVLNAASWRLLAAAAGGERDAEALTWLGSAWRHEFAKELAASEKPLTTLRSAWALSESSLALPKDAELRALAKTALELTAKSADAALAALEKNPDDGGAFITALYAELALRDGRALGAVEAKRQADFSARAVPLLTAARKDSALEPIRAVARALLGRKTAGEELVKVYERVLAGDDMATLTALAARRTGGAAWLAFRAEAREKFRDAGISGSVVLLASRLEKPTLPSAK